MFISEEFQQKQTNKQKEQHRGSSVHASLVWSSPNSKQSNLAPAAYASILRRQ
jgi:hypothetical protein